MGSRHRTPMWEMYRTSVTPEVETFAIVRVKDQRGYPPAPRLEGQLTRARSTDTGGEGG